MAGKSKAAASGRWRRRRTQDTMAKPTAQELGSSADSGPAPRRRRSGRGSLYSSTSLALPRRAARYAGPPRATRAASRRACRSHRQRWRSEEVGAGPQMRSQREKRDSRCCRKGEEQPAVERRAAQARRRRPGSRAGSRGSIERAIAPEPARPGPVDPPRKLAMLYSMPRAYRIGSRRATSYAGSPPAASSKTRAEPRRAWRAHPHARGRRQARRACWRLCQAPAQQSKAGALSPVPKLCQTRLQVPLPWLPLASPLARRDAARDESCPRAGPLASPHNHHCSEPVPGCTPCCDRRRARGSLRESPRIWHNRIADLSAAERAAAGRLHA